ncbi:MAG: AI-2E family transporter [Puia sp.]|nr:AI-2E family transporter [Puia sp.]
MKSTRTYPFYFKSTVILFGLILFSCVLYFLKGIFTPLAFGILLAILLNPVVSWMEDKKCPKPLAILLTLILAIVIAAGLCYLFYTQFLSFSSQLPAFKKKGAELFAQFQQFLSSEAGITTARQSYYIDQGKQALQSWAGSSLGTVATTMGTLFILPVYAFLFLYYKNLLVNFMYEIFLEQNSEDVSAVLTQTKKAVQSYMIGLLLEAVIVACLNASALLILGVKYAILLGAMGAVLNILPFIGGILAIIPPLLIATITKNGLHTQVGIIITYMVIQFIDNHFLVPYIVSAKVKINALISIIIVLMGGAVWGVAGMFLSIPFIGVLKIIFDRVPDLKPWGKLLGDQVPAGHKGQMWNKITRKVIS